MKRFLLALACVLALGGCSVCYPVNHLPLDEAWAKTASYRYIEDQGPWESFKTPAQFEADGGGDCKSFSVYLVYLLGPESKLVLIPGHAIVEYQGHYLEPQIYKRFYDPNSIIVKQEWDYTQTMRTAFRARTKPAAPRMVLTLP
jgi:hypothetical protein